MTQVSGSPSEGHGLADRIGARRLRLGEGRGRLAVIATFALALAAWAIAAGSSDAGDSPITEGTAGPFGTGEANASPELDAEEPGARPEVDLAAAPPTAHASDLARWWAATYTAYVGSESPPLLARRLAPASTPDLIEAMAEVEPSLSYDLGVLPVEGASAGPIRATGIGAAEVIVVVETSGAIVAYEISLGRVGDGWRVAGAAAL